MRQFLAVIVLISSLYGQAKQARSVPTEAAMDIDGVTVALGLPKSKVLDLITQTRFKTVEMPSEGKYTKMALTDEDVTDPVKRNVAMAVNDGKLYFENGNLIRIMLEHYTEATTDRSLAFSLYAIIKGLQAKNGADHCVLRTSDETAANAPSIDVKGILLLCDEHNASRAIQVRWSTSEALQQQQPVRVFEELWRE